MALSNETFRRTYASTRLASTLRKSLVAEKICKVDTTDSKYIDNPYITTPTTTVQAVAGTYTAGRLTTTDDRLAVTDEFITAVNIPDFESKLSSLDVFNSTIDGMGYSVRDQINTYVVNNLLEEGTGTYTTPTGGFATAANVNTIFSNLLGKVAGYADVTNGFYVVIENTDLPGIIEAGATNGFNFADAVLNGGQVGRWMGVDIYVVRTGTFADATLGTKTYTNAGHRLFGVKGASTFAMPGGVVYDEKKVDGITGMQVLTFGYVGHKLWATKAELVVDITLA